MGGRTKNSVDSVSFQITTTQRVTNDLERLARTGYFGKNKNEAAEQLMRAQLRSVRASGEFEELTKRRSKPTKRSKAS